MYFWKSKRRKEDNIKIGLGDVGSVELKLTQMPQYRFQWQTGSS
jgi:hypothetical protein